MILANITTPLLGLVDTAVLGHLPGTHKLAGAAIGALILTQIYWVCGFLRMSTTGLSAQAKGRQSPADSARVLLQSALVGVVIGIVILSFQWPILNTGQYLASADGQVAASIEAYFSVRVWGAPAALINLALIGWLVGQQATRVVMVIQIIANLINAVLDLLFVFVFDWGVPGVAFASICAEWFICLSGIWFALDKMGVKLSFGGIGHKLADVMTLNSDMLVRNLALQLCLAFLSFQGARLGELTAATNAILLQFFVLIALGLDGIAYGVEALVGEAKGQRRSRQLAMVTWRGVLWSSIFALAYSLVFVLAGDHIIVLLTDQPRLQTAAQQMLPLMWLLPVIAHWCFLFDGVYIGLTRARDMRNSMIVSAALVYFPLWWVLKDWGNVALWLALLAFLLARGVTLGGHFYYLQRRHALLD